MTRKEISRCGLLMGAALLLGHPLTAEEFTVSGFGTAPVRKASRKDQPKVTQQAVAAAEVAAVADGLSRAVLKIQSRSSLPPGFDAVSANLARHSSEFVVRRQMPKQAVEHDVINVELLLTIDAVKLREYLKDMEIASPTDALDQRRVIVLSYTIEGMDPNRESGAKLHEVIVSRDRYLQRQERGERVLYDQQKSGSLQEGHAARADSAYANRSGVERAAGLADFLFGVQQNNYEKSANQSVGRISGADAGFINSQNQSREQFDRQFHKELMTVAARDYVRVTEYADLTRKGQGTSNEVRAKLEEIFSRAGFPARLYNLKLAGLEFGSEDDLIDVVLSRVLEDPQVSDQDFVVIALNRLTPVNTAHRYTSAVTYRVIRKGDQDLFLPSKSVLGDSGDQPSDDFGRGIATEAALSRAAAVLPPELEDALKRMQRLSKAVAPPVTTYEIKIGNVTSMADSGQLKQALEAAGFSFRNSFQSRQRSETIVVDLNGRPPGQVRVLVERNLTPFDASSVNERQAVLVRP